MATILPTITKVQGGALVVWAGLGTGDDGAWVSMPQYPLKTVTVEGTVTTFALQGTNDAGSTNPRTLEDEDNTAITAAGVYKLKENPIKIRPLLTTGSTVNVRMMCAR